MRKIFVSSQRKSSQKKIRLKFVGGFDFKEKEVVVEGEKRYSDVLRDLGINPETVVVVKDGTPVPTDDFVEDGEIVIMRVISGG